jgi:hypothetical protein
MSDLLDMARQQLERVKLLTTQCGLKYLEQAPFPLGVGIGVAFEETQYVVVTIMGGDSSNQCSITSGVLRDITKDRLRALDACNHRNQANAAYPFFVHEAELGWDILLQQTFPLQILFAVPSFYANCVQALPLVTADARIDFEENWSLGGIAYSWSDEDVRRLFIRSML